MKTVTLFDPSTGVFCGICTVPDSAFARMVRDGVYFKEGRFDRRTQRVDLEIGDVVAYDPPVDPVAEQAAKSDGAHRAIRTAEQAQARAVREALLAILPDGPEKARLQKIDDEIASKRGDL